MHEDSLEDNFIEEASTSLTQDSSKSIGKKWLRRFIWIYSIIVTIMLIRNFRTNQFGTKHMDYRLNASMTGIVFFHKETKEILEISYDRNFDNNIESVESYYKDLKIASRMKDANEDGFIEEVTYYDKNGKESGYSLDNDSDNYLEKISFILENGEFLNLIDLDKNGKFEIE